MEIKELEKIMVANGVVLRAIPEKKRDIYEKRYIEKFPNGKITYMEEYKREMLVVESTPKNHGKFIFEQKAGTDSLVRFNPQKYYDTIEQAVEALLKQNQ